MKTIPYLLYVLIDGHFRVRGALDVSHFSLGASSIKERVCFACFCVEVHLEYCD